MRTTLKDNLSALHFVYMYFHLPTPHSLFPHVLSGGTYSNADPFWRCDEVEAEAVVRTGSWELPPVSVAIVIVKNVKNPSTVK